MAVQTKEPDNVDWAAVCDNCNEPASYRFIKPCATCGTEMLVCNTCSEEWVETNHDNCEQ